MAIPNPLRHQLPAYSPLTLAGLTRAALRAGSWRGPDPLRELEDHLVETFQAQEVVLTGSGTDGLTLALAVAGAVADDAMGKRRHAAALALPAYSCFDVATAALIQNRPLRFYDLDPGTLGPDPESLRKALGQGVGVLVLAPLFAVPLDWREVESVIDDAGGPELQIVEDAAQGFGGRDERGIPIGGRGDLSVLSFGRGKGWTGGGGGGALLVRSARAQRVLARELEEVRPSQGGGREGRPLGRRGPGPGRRGEDPGREVDTLPASPILQEQPGSRGIPELGRWGRAAALWGLARPGVYRLPRSLPFLGLGETHLRPGRIPRTMGSGEAARIMAMAGEAGAAVRSRQGAAEDYGRWIGGKGMKGIVRTVVAPPDTTPGWLRYPIRMERGMAGFTRPAQAQRMGAAPGYPQALPHLKAVVPSLAGEGGGQQWPGARELVASLVTLPTHTRTRAREREALVELIG